jgi:hypothetical protein
VIVTRTLYIVDSLARANVFEALGGSGRPAGVIACTKDGDHIDLCFDDAVSSQQLIDDVVTIARTFAPEPVIRAARGERVRIAAHGLAEPDLDETRLLETYLPE